ncbi:MAG: hypothetical protein PF541_07355 [Prolixibacteraceae bacterium]|jgi:hypothetical protein|nr:hypothetical protein [Prolixibacteraceae bacterium]
MEKKLGLSVFVFLFVLLGVLSANRNTIYFKDIEWKVLNEKGELITENEQLEINETIELYFNIDDSEYSLALLSLSDFASNFIVYLNHADQPIIDQPLDYSFYTDVTSFIEGNVLVVSLKAKKELPFSKVNRLFEYAQLNLVQGASINHFTPLKDAFFGGSLINVSIQNTSEKDVDGKVIVRVSDPESWEILAENNNCAFARGNSIIEIEVNFSDRDKIVSGNEYLVTVSMVDKEQNEAVIDELILPVVF